MVLGNVIHLKLDPDFSKYIICAFRTLKSNPLYVYQLGYTAIILLNINYHVPSQLVLF